MIAFCLATQLVSMAMPASLAAAEPACRTAQLTPAAQLVNSSNLLVIAHRGDSKAFPENTLPAFDAAVAVGSDLVELDYHHSADGVPVVMHDPTLDRTTDARHRWADKPTPVAAVPLRDLEQLDAGTWFANQFAGTRVPTLDEALDHIQRGSMTLIERKAGDAATCVSLLREKGLVESVVVQSFDWNFVAECHRLEPRLVLGALGGHELDEARLDQIEATGARLVVWHQKSLDAATIEAIHRRGLRAWAFTVDDPRRAEELIRAGLDGIITNVPAEMLALAERLGRRTTADAAGCGQALSCSHSSACCIAHGRHFAAASPWHRRLRLRRCRR